MVTRSVPQSLDGPRNRASEVRFVDLSHVITDGMETYPGLPTPIIGTHLSRRAAEQIYESGTTFQIGLITMCTNTGTYIDVPFHRDADGYDLSELTLDRCANRPAVCLDHRGERAIDIAPHELTGLAGHAVLIRTDHSVYFGTAAYFHDHPALTAAAAAALVEAGVACVGIDTVNIDATSTGARPVHTILLRAGIPIVEHLTNLVALPARFTFSAVPPKIVGAGTFTVRAFAMI